MERGEESKPQLRCVAEQPPADKSSPLHPNAQSRSPRTGQWCADGSCIVQVTPDGAIQTIVVPQDLLENDEKHELEVYSQYQPPNPIYSTALYPGFGVSCPDNALVLYAARNTPIQLRHAFHLPDRVYASYKWNNPNTEATITPHCLTFTPDATHFVAGSQTQFAVYDVTRPSESQIRVRRTSKSRYALKTFGRDSKKPATGPGSIVTCMDITAVEDVLAIGTNTRHVALYGDHGLGDLITSFRVPLPSSSAAGASGVRRGITQVKWSADGTYLFVAERQSDIIGVYDIRQSYKRLGWLSGRKAEANFQMGFDVVPTTYGLEVWAGGTDGYMRMWSNPEQQEGELVPSEAFKVHEDAVCATQMHFSGSVVATLSTKDRYASRASSESNVSLSSASSGCSDSSSGSSGSEDDESSEGTDDTDSSSHHSHSDATLKLWSIT